MTLIPTPSTLHLGGSPAKGSTSAICSFRVAATAGGARMVHNLETDGREFFERQVDKLEQNDLVAMRLHRFDDG